jgi:hypothetical protein
MTRRLAALQLVLALSFCHVALAQHTGAFTPTADMMTARTGHTATLLPDGKVLIAGGKGCCGPGSTFFSAELYDPSTGSFTATGNMSTGRYNHTAILLPDGKVLIAGGFCSGVGACTLTGPLASAELYDPATGTFSATGNMATADGNLPAILLNDGKVLIAHGRNAAELYDPVTGTFSRTGDPLREGPQTATLLPDGRVLLVTCCMAEQLYDPASGTFSLTDKTKRIWHDGFGAAALTDGTVLFAGGYIAEGDTYSSGAELYDPSSESFRPTGNMTTGRSYHTATLLPDGTVLIAGGEGKPSSNPTATTSAEIYDPAIGAFSRTGDMTDGHIEHKATLLLDGRVLLTGGYTEDLNPASAELYVPSVLVPVQVVTELRFDHTSVVGGSSFSAKVSGSNLTPETFFDLRFTSPESNESAVALNWQKGLAASHEVPAGLASGSWKIIGVRAHEVESDHTGIFFPVSATLTVSRQPSDAIMNPGDFLLPGQSRQSADGRFRLVYQVDGNLVLYQESNPLWATATFGTTPGFVAMQTDGNFVVYDSAGAVWASNTWGHPGSFLVVQDDGNTVIYSAGSSPLWATNTCCR